MSEYESIEIRVTGRVQGVGFRWFTQNAAAKYRIFGWVKNMPDGSVLIRAVGDAGNMQAFRDTVREGPAFSSVEHFEEAALDPNSAVTFESFEIAY